MFRMKWVWHLCHATSEKASCSAEAIMSCASEANIFTPHNPCATWSDKGNPTLLGLCVSQRYTDDLLESSISKSYGYHQCFWHDTMVLSYLYIGSIYHYKQVVVLRQRLQNASMATPSSVYASETLCFENDFPQISSITLPTLAVETQKITIFAIVATSAASLLL